MRTFTSISFSFILGLMLLVGLGCNSNTAPDDGLYPSLTPSQITDCGKMGVKINGVSWVATDLSSSVWVKNTSDRTLTMDIRGGDNTYVKIVMKDVTSTAADGIALGDYALERDAAAGSNSFRIFYRVNGQTTEMNYGHLKITACDKLLKKVSGTFDFDDNITNTRYAGLEGSFVGVCYK